MKGASVAFAATVLTAGGIAQAQDVAQPLAVLAAPAQSVQQQLNALKAEVTALQIGNAALQGQVGALRNQLSAARNVLALAPFVNVDPNPQAGVIGPNVTFKGVNLHLVSGSGATDDHGNPTGLGNLILGYDESPAQSPSLPLALNAGDRGGSHNLVIGRYHRFTQATFGGLVAGEQNTLSNQAASVSGGFRNAASGLHASVSGGALNTASAEDASVSGGFGNVANNLSASVSGGEQNSASGPVASVLGGESNTASGPLATVLGGFQNTASGQATVVLGGLNVTDANPNAVAPTVAP